MNASIKPVMSVEAIAKVEGTSAGAVNMVLCRALKKLRNQRLIITCRELAIELDRNRKGIVG